MYRAERWHKEIIASRMIMCTDLAVEIAEAANLALVGRLLSAPSIIGCKEKRILSESGVH